MYIYIYIFIYIYSCMYQIKIKHTYTHSCTYVHVMVFLSTALPWYVAVSGPTCEGLEGTPPCGNEDSCIRVKVFHDTHIVCIYTRAAVCSYRPPMVWSDNLPWFGMTLSGMRESVALSSKGSRRGAGGGGQRGRLEVQGTRTFHTQACSAHCKLPQSLLCRYTHY